METSLSKPRRWLKFVLLGMLALLVCEQVFAFEVTGYGGLSQYEPLSGCCQAVPARTSYAFDLRLEVENGIWEVFGHSDRKWNEVSILKSHYLLGEYVKPDPISGSSEGMKVTRIQKFYAVLSYGAGFFVHTTRTVAFDLPIVVNGILLVGNAEIQYAITDRFSAVGLFHTGFAWAQDDRGFKLAGLGGLLMRF